MCASALFAIGAPSNSAHAQPASAEAAYDRAAKAWSSQNSVEAKFEQSITNSLLGRTVSSRGTFQQQKPNKISITFTSPAGDRIVADGKSLWVYLPSSVPGQVMKLPADAEGAVVADMLGQLLDAPKRSFVISGGESATVEGKSTRRVQLVPRESANVPFQKAILWLDESESRPVKVQVIDSQGTERVITLMSWTPNAKFSARTFTFTPPAGVKVITRIPGS